MILRIVIAAILAVALQGCWFVYVPGSMVSSISDSLTGAEGNLCVSDSVQVGNRVRMPDGKIGTVDKLSGTSSRCPNPTTPIRAVVTAD